MLAPVIISARVCPTGRNKLELGPFKKRLGLSGVTFSRSLLLIYMPHSLVSGSIRGLACSSIYVGAHLHPNRLQDLLDPHISVPILHGGEFAHDDFTMFVRTAHGDFRDKTDIGGLRGVRVGAMNSDFVEPIRIVSLIDT